MQVNFSPPAERMLQAARDTDLRARHELDILGYSETVSPERLDVLEDCSLNQLHADVQGEYRLSGKQLRKAIGMCRQMIREAMANE